MDKNNFFIAREEQPSKKIVHWGNSILKKLGINYKMIRGLDPMKEMNTLEQRINFFHLLTSVIEQNIPGEIVELGSFNGQCAMLFQEILNFNRSEKKLHLYDSFEHHFTTERSAEDVLLKNFASRNLTPPAIHKGLFQSTLPTQLPATIAFAHIDCGFGGNPQLHKQIVLFCLEQVYPKLSKGGLCVLMDYHDAQSGDLGIDCNPGVKLASDDFFKDKEKEIISLYGNEASHAYFRKK